MPSGAGTSGLLDIRPSRRNTITGRVKPVAAARSRSGPQGANHRADNVGGSPACSKSERVDEAGLLAGAVGYGQERRVGAGGAALPARSATGPSAARRRRLILNSVNADQVAGVIRRAGLTISDAAPGHLICSGCPARRRAVPKKRPAAASTRPAR
jgi:hypothetical protein